MREEGEREGNVRTGGSDGGPDSSREPLILIALLHVSVSYIHIKSSTQKKLLHAKCLVEVFEF